MSRHAHLLALLDAGRGYDLTAKQYAYACHQELHAAYPDITLREIQDAYPLASYANEWLDKIRRHAAAGGTLRRAVLDCLWRVERRCYVSLVHDYPTCLPDGYLNPEARRINGENRIKIGRKSAKLGY